jgi:hypothetical protein
MIYNKLQNLISQKVIQMIHGERYMKTMATLQFLYGWETAYWFSICRSVDFHGCIDYMKTLVHCIC